MKAINYLVITGNNMKNKKKMIELNYEEGVGKMVLWAEKPLTQAQENFINSLDMNDVRGGRLTTSIFRQMFALDIYCIGAKLYTKMPNTWLNDTVDSRLSYYSPGLTYRDCFIILCEDETDCLVRLAFKSSDGNIREELSETDLKIYIGICGNNNILNHKDALIERANMIGE